MPPYGYDALNYHLPTVVTWIQGQRIVATPLNECCAHYPAGGELLFAWSVIFLQDVAWADSVQIGFAVAGAVAVGGIARTAGFTPAGGLAASSLFLLTPVVLAQANTAYVDVIFASAFLIAVHFVHRCMSGAPTASLLFPAGLATAICLGSKPNGVLATVILILSVCLLLLAQRRKGAYLASIIEFSPSSISRTCGFSWWLVVSPKLDSAWQPVLPR